MAWTGSPENKVPNVAQTSEVKSEARVEVNRALEVRRDLDKQKNPTVRLIDIDSAIMKQLEKFQLKVSDVMMPDHMVMTYHFIIWTEYVEQMNVIVERLNFEAEDYWGEKRGMKFRTKIDSFSHTIDLQVDQDRMVKSEFDLMVYGYLL